MLVQESQYTGSPVDRGVEGCCSDDVGQVARAGSSLPNHVLPATAPALGTPPVVDTFACPTPHFLSCGAQRFGQSSQFIQQRLHAQPLHVSHRVMELPQSFTLNNGRTVPAIGLGTFQGEVGNALVRDAVKVALQLGYRHIDGASAYGNEREIGEAIKESGIPREEIFVTSKL